jgi:FkbM family methyltransferase
VWQQLAKRSRVIVDLGAGAGFYSLLAARVAPPGASIYCFEPDAGNFARLVRNIESNRIASIVATQAAQPDQSMRTGVLAALSLARVDAKSATREVLSMVAEATGGPGPELLIETAPGAQFKAVVASLGGKGYLWFGIDDDSYRVYPVEDYTGSEMELPAMLWATTRPVKEAQELLQAAGASVVQRLA